MFVINGKKTFARVFIDEIDDTTRKQIEQIVDHPALTNPISIMPDCHAGKGCVIGFTMQAGDCIIPNLIGVDIGCGARVCNISNVYPDRFDGKMLDQIIREKIPSGMNARKTPIMSRQGYHHDGLFEKVEKTCHRINAIDKLDYFCASLGTLGGGNHMIEVDFDFNTSIGGIYILVHTGSRNFGLTVANFYQNKAKELCQAMHLDLPQGTEFLPLAYGGSDYLEDMRVAQEYAEVNRKAIIHDIIMNMWPMMTLGFREFESVHNYISPRGNMIRKGAISAQDGESVIIPLNMRDGILIGVGKGSKDWNFSAPHGAGRLMSRTEAKKKLNMEDYKATMDGIYTTSICEETLDEAPGAYKDAELIKSLIGDTVLVQKHLKPIYNYKDSSKGERD
jgi:RNA-splicing ligase RtcB